MSGHSPRSSDKKALEQQFHSDRIDGGNAERVADGAVGSRSAALDENILLMAESDQVPDDQEISGQLEFFDQSKFAFDLAAGASLQFRSGAAVTRLKSFAGALAQERHHALAFGHRIFWKLIAQAFEGEFETGRKLDSIGDGLGQIGEERLHFCGDFTWHSELRTAGDRQCSECDDGAGR